MFYVCCVIIAELIVPRVGLSVEQISKWRGPELGVKFGGAAAVIHLNYVVGFSFFIKKDRAEECVSAWFGNNSVPFHLKSVGVSGCVMVKKEAPCTLVQSRGCWEAGLGER